MNKKIKYTIFSMPRSIGFTCPHCNEEVEINVKDLCKTNDMFELNDVECPSCGETAYLDSWNYD